MQCNGTLQLHAAICRAAMWRCATISTVLARRASYCEIYNERLYDLLKWTQQPLPVRWSAARGFHVPDLALRPCPSMAELLKARHTLGAQQPMGFLSWYGSHPCCHTLEKIARTQARKLCKLLTVLFF